MPISMREWMIARKVSERTTGRPPSTSERGRGDAWRGQPVVERNQRIDAEQQIDAFLQGDGGVNVFVKAPST